MGRSKSPTKIIGNNGRRQTSQESRGKRGPEKDRRGHEAIENTRTNRRQEGPRPSVRNIDKKWETKGLTS
ncbi:pumilio-like protein 23 isoform X1 [Sesbania bispinosa]|nr:pumilio-like protein 23 isoform X1 [Sesbania bispinosa]